MSLVNRFAGKGEAVNGFPKQAPGYKERVNFGQNIGNYVDENTGLSYPSTKGIIIYSKTGVHIYPIRP
ncbi:MAG TPA: polymorphic toxin type 50 domain-containing protein [Vampirovibrionales bacterium]